MIRENFTLSKEGRRDAKWIMFRKVLTACLLLTALAGLITLYLFHMSFWQWIAFGVTAILMIGFCVERAWNNDAIDFHDWGLHLDEKCVYLTSRSPGGSLDQRNEIRRGDVRKVIESSSGLIVKGFRFGQQIWIPAGVEDYATIRDELNQWREENQGKADENR